MWHRPLTLHYYKTPGSTCRVLWAKRWAFAAFFLNSFSVRWQFDKCYFLSILVEYSCSLFIILFDFKMSNDQSSNSSGEIELIDTEIEASLQLQRWTAQASTNTASRQRGERPVRRTFVHLRLRDRTVSSIPRRRRLDALQNEGRIKMVEFTKNCTEQEIKRLVMTVIPSLAGQER